MKKIIRLKVFQHGWYRIQYKSSVIINRNIKGYIVRNKHQDKIIRIRRAGLVARQTKAAISIQKIQRGITVRRILKRMNRAAFYIQGYFKSKWLQNMLKRIKRAVVIIQHNFRVFFYQKREKKEINKCFYEVCELEMNSLKLKETQILQGMNLLD